MEITLSKGVLRSKKWSYLVKRYVHDNQTPSGKSLFETIKDFMYFAALLGYSKNIRLPLSAEDGTEDIQAHIFSNDKNVGIIYALALAEVKDSSILKEENEKSMLQIFEEYANGGFAILNDWQKASDESGDFSLIQGLIDEDFFELNKPDSNSASEFDNFTIE